jgi:hypothetical protein
MPLFRLDNQAIGRLMSLPESGMGYQLVQFLDNLLLVFNATIVIPFAELRGRHLSEDDFNHLSGDPDTAAVEGLSRSVLRAT